MDITVLDAYNNLKADFELNDNEFITKELLLELLTERVLYFMEYNLEYFWSLLYRMDVSEQKVKAVLDTDVDVPNKIATLILERQQEKSASRQLYKFDNIPNDLRF